MAQSSSSTAKRHGGRILFNNVILLQWFIYFTSRSLVASSEMATIDIGMAENCSVRHSQLGTWEALGLDGGCLAQPDVSQSGECRQPPLLYSTTSLSEP
jgi:hypothetical protein